MKFLLDACTIVFLTNGNLLEVVLRLPGRTWFVGQIVFAECRYKGAIIPELQQAVGDGKVTLLDDSTINAADFLSLLQTYRLGDGETECLAYASSADFIVCTDDKKARTVTESLLGEGRVTGVLGIMKDSVQSKLISSDEASEAYRLMRAKGAFLPDIPVDFFNSAELPSMKEK